VINPWLDLLELLSPDYLFTLIALWLATIELLFPPTERARRMNRSEFRTELVTRTLDDCDEELSKPLIYYSALLGREIVVPASFRTDLASVPRLPLAYLLAGGHAKKAAVVHDYLYTMQFCTRAQADAVFEEAMAASDQPWWRRKLMWLGVRVGGSGPWNENRNEPKGDVDEEFRDSSPGA
jgi:hypothetical protein